MLTSLLYFIFVVEFFSIVSATPFVTNNSTGVSYHGTSADGVEQFQNIFFGQSTSGDARFAPPQLYIPSENATINATQPGAACPQPKVPVQGVSFFSNVTNISEDCLSLRIARPSNTSATDKLPVMVWIYGGGDTIGQIYDQIYTPTRLVLRATANGLPIIYVAVNYRVNLFGFASSDTLREAKSLNVGLKDQRLGIQWVKDNIAAFGGDAEKITIFGESDGATGVGLQLTAYGGKQGAPFQRAIMQSGSAAADPGVTSNISATNFAAVAAKANCTSGSSGSEETLACLRNLSMEALLELALGVAVTVSPPFGLDAYFPVIDNDFIPAAPSSLVKTGQFSKNISVIVGWNADDGSFFTSTSIANDSDVADFLAIDFPGLTNSTIANILTLYPVADFEPEVAPNDTVNAQYYRASRILRDIEFSCPGIDLAYSVMKHNKHADARLYELNQTSFALLYAEDNIQYLGVSHSSDIFYVFNEVAALNASSSDTLLAAQMSGSWAAFAATGNPAPGTSKDATTLGDWPVAYSVATTGGTVPTEAIVNVIGGPYAGPSEIGKHVSHGPVGMENLLHRCAFLNSIYDQLQT